MNSLILVLILLIPALFIGLSYILFLVALALIVILGPIVTIFQFFRKIYRRESISRYLHTIAVSLDQLGAAIIYGEEDWCVSSIAYYHVKYENKNALFMHLINFLFWDKEHCKVSFETEYKELGRYPK